MMGKAAGGQVQKNDKYGSNYERQYPDTTSRNRSQVFAHVNENFEKMYGQKENMAYPS